MSNKVRVVHNLSRLTDDQVVTLAATVRNCLTDNPAYPAPAVDMQSLQDSTDAFALALAVKSQGGMAATAEKNSKRRALTEQLLTLARYVEETCENNLSVLLSSGFRAASNNHARSPLGIPSVRKIILSRTGEMTLQVLRIAQAKSYEIQCAVVGTGGVCGPWQTAGVCTAAMSMRVADLVPGTVYTFRVRAIGGSTGASDWSLPVSRMCA